jgi:1-acyl-sn-glycerol-3-phosphate acyltransferase
VGNPVYTTVIGLVLGIFKVMRWDVRVTGAEHVPATGGGVVATNHVGYLDFVFAATACDSRASGGCGSWPSARCSTTPSPGR